MDAIANRLFAYLELDRSKEMYLCQIMKTERLKQSYRNQLIKAGIAPHRAEQAADTLTPEELRLIGEIWPEWTAAFSPVEVQVSQQS